MTEAKAVRVWQIGPDGTEYYAARSEEEMKAYYRLNSDPETCESDLAEEMQEVLDLDNEFPFDDDGEKVMTTWRKLTESCKTLPCQIRGIIIVNSLAGEKAGNK
jgi:hypothetical protein